MPATLELERTLSQVRFRKVKGNIQKSKKGLRVQPFFPGSMALSAAKTERKLVSLTLKKDAETKRMQKLFARNYQMQTTWLLI